MSVYSHKVIRDKFKGLEFDAENHRYYVGKDRYPSVSGVVGSFYKPFDTENVSKGYALKHGFLHEDVLDAWTGEAKKATDHGTKVHEFAENFANFHFGTGPSPDLTPVVTCKQGLGVVQFFADLPNYVIPIATELRMFSEELGYAGTMDQLLYNTRHGYYIIADWKTNKELTSSYPQDPLLHLPKELGLLQDNFGKYTVQFSLYQLLLESVGLKVGSRVLIWLNEQEDKKLYKAIKTLDITKELKQILTIL